MKNQASAAKQAVVIGGSLGGLFAGLLLRSIRTVVKLQRKTSVPLRSSEAPPNPMPSVREPRDFVNTVGREFSNLL